jgi:hypothetical protein
MNEETVKCEGCNVVVPHQWAIPDDDDPIYFCPRCACGAAYAAGKEARVSGETSTGETKAKAERKGMAEDQDVPGTIEVVQVDDEPVYISPRTWCSEGLCVCVVHDGQFALVLSSDGAREMAGALVRIAKRIDEAKKALQGESA